MAKVRVLVVEDSVTIRKRLVEVLEQDPTFEVVGEAADGRQAIDRCMALLAPSGKLVFSNNAQKFKLDAEVGGSYKVTDISRATLPKDFERNPRIHQCFELERKP